MAIYSFDNTITPTATFVAALNVIATTRWHPPFWLKSSSIQLRPWQRPGNYCCVILFRRKLWLQFSPHEGATIEPDSGSIRIIPFLCSSFIHHLYHFHPLAIYTIIIPFYLSLFYHLQQTTPLQSTHHCCWSSLSQFFFLFPWFSLYFQPLIFCAFLCFSFNKVQSDDAAIANVILSSSPLLPQPPSSLFSYKTFF